MNQGDLKPDMGERERYSNMRGVSVEEVIRVEINEGEGVEGDPIRRVVYYYTKEGKLIGHDDTVTAKLRFGEDVL